MNRKIGLFHDTLLMLLTMEAVYIKEELYRYFGRNTDAPSKAALYRQRRKLADDAWKCDPATVYLADMGYASYNNFAHVIENRLFFLIRYNDRRLKGILDRSVEDLKETDCRIERILIRTQSKKK